MRAGRTWAGGSCSLTAKEKGCDPLVPSWYSIVSSDINHRKASSSPLLPLSLPPSPTPSLLYFLTSYVRVLIDYWITMELVSWRPSKQSIQTSVSTPLKPTDDVSSSLIPPCLIRQTLLPNKEGPWFPKKDISGRVRRIGRSASTTTRERMASVRVQARIMSSANKLVCPKGRERGGRGESRRARIGEERLGSWIEPRLSHPRLRQGRLPVAFLHEWDGARSIFASNMRAMVIIREGDGDGVGEADRLLLILPFCFWIVD